MPAKSKAALERKRAWRKDYDAARTDDRRGKGVKARARKWLKGKHRQRMIVAIDGEGWGRKPHRYTMLTWSNQTGHRGDTLSNDDGLSTGDCLRFLHDTLPGNALCFMFAYGYDLTKILADLDNQTLWLLEHPAALPKTKSGAQSWVKWGGWAFRKQGTCFSFGLLAKKADRTFVKRWVTIWDAFKFFGTSFVKAVGPKGWNVATKKELALLTPMKASRSKFKARDAKKIQSYNELECRLLCRLMGKLLDSFKESKLVVKSYYGPGSVAAAMLQTMVPKRYFKVLKRQYLRQPEDFRHAVMSAFFGGRFETRVIGEFDKLYEWDINSAYPAAIAELPCLLHGSWKRVRLGIRPKHLCLVRYKLYKHERDETPAPWGPFPFRHNDGSISFPIESGGGWVWGEEFYAAYDTGLWPNLDADDAWEYVPSCKHRTPFASTRKWYDKRIDVGKDTGPGLAIKLGINSLYGKMAQSVGSAPFNSWIYAGLITAHCRAQILRAIALHRDPRNLLSIATDGILTHEKLFVPTKALGEWGGGKTEGRVWIVRPGVLIGSHSKTKARGIGSDVLKGLRGAIDKQWKKTHDLAGWVKAPKLTRFIGMKQGIRFYDGGWRRGEDYGEWIERPQLLSFEPMPKREGFEPGSKSDLKVRRLPQTEVSAPYDKTIESPDAKTIQIARQEAEDQPDLEDT